MTRAGDDAACCQLFHSPCLLPACPPHCRVWHPAACMLRPGLCACELTWVHVRSWLGKLETAKQVLVDQAPKLLPQLDALANAYIYLQVHPAP